MTANAIIVRNLEKYFPPSYSGWRALMQPVARLTLRALAGVSFSVEPGEAVALIGENGAGKSTLLRVLATLIVPSRGQAEILSCDVAGVFSNVCVGAPPDENHRNSHAYLVMKRMKTAGAAATRLQSKKRYRKMA